MFRFTTTARSLNHRPTWVADAAGKMRLATLVGLMLSATTLSAQPPGQHLLGASQLPPGAIGSQRLLSEGPLSFSQPPAACVQAVRISAPPGIEISAASDGAFTTPRAGSLLAGLIVGPVYRFHARGVAGYKKVDVYPTVELIDRLHPPAGKELKFPVPVQLTQEELELAAAGSFVTRVIYVEDPNQALPLAEAKLRDGRREQSWFEARPDQNPLTVADALGRPIAIVRIGSRLPGSNGVYRDPPIQLHDEHPQP